MKAPPNTSLKKQIPSNKNKHRHHLKSKCLVVTAVTSLLLAGAHARTWTSADGSKTFEGELQSYEPGNGTVTVTLPNGKRMNFTQDKLSEDDIAWLKKNGGRSGGGSSSGIGELPDSRMLNKLRTELTAKIPKIDQEKAKATGSPEERRLKEFLASDALDAKLVKYVVLHEATLKGLAEFAGHGKEQAVLVEQLLADDELMKQMLVADGAKGGKYGPAMKIYTDIQKASRKAKDGVLQRLALAIALEHAVPSGQQNAYTLTDAPKTVDPLKRFLSYEKAYLGGELDPMFDHLDAWNLRFVVNAGEPDEILAWGRKMLRNYRPDHIYTANHGWRYVSLVKSTVRYGSGGLKWDSLDLQSVQNVIMNGGVCGRRAFFGRFILRAFGIPTTARPSRKHAALCHWTPKGWVVCLGPPWGYGHTPTSYGKDLNFLASTQARVNRKGFLKVKRAQWAGAVMDRGFWNGVANNTQQAVIKEAKAVTLAPLGEEFGEANEPTVAEKVMASPAKEEDKKIKYGKNGVIVIPAAATKSRGIIAMKSFAGGVQLFLPGLNSRGRRLLRGGARSEPHGCKSGFRLRSSGVAVYNNWGLRAAMSHRPGMPKKNVTLDLGKMSVHAPGFKIPKHFDLNVKMEMIYIKPGKFVMGGENTRESKWRGVEVPKHEVTISKGFYIGKYEVTQAQFLAATWSNPSRSGKGPNHPVNNIGEWDAAPFCEAISRKTGQDVRLPTEAEWEYACRAGTKTKYFFGDTPARLGDYAWSKGNDGGRSHPVGQKKPNPWGLYDIYGNVWERVADTYARDYYAKSPKKDPTGPSQGTKSHFEYKVTVPRSGKYSLEAQICNVNYDQRLNVSANSSPESVMAMPFTCGSWEVCKPVTLVLKQGENVLRFWRDNPPQYGMAIKSFTLKPVR